MSDQLFHWEEEQGEPDLDEFNARAMKIHRLFKQDPDGAEIMADMVRATIRCPVVQPNDTQFAAGIREGRARVTRDILDMIEYAESLSSQAH